MKDLAKKIIISGVKCKAYKVGNIAMSSNNAIDHTFLWKYGLDLTYEGISKLSDNFLDYTSFLLPSNDFIVNKFNNNLVF